MTVYLCRQLFNSEETEKECGVKFYLESVEIFCPQLFFLISCPMPVTFKKFENQMLVCQDVSQQIPQQRNSLRLTFEQNRRQLKSNRTTQELNR